MNEPSSKDGEVLFRASQEVELRGTLLRFTRFSVAFELYGSGVVLRLSEALRCFRILVRGRTLYAGRAVVRSLVDTGPALVCEVELDDSAWNDLALAPTARVLSSPSELGGQFLEFLAEWQKAYQVRPEYKVIVADMQTFFAGLRLWLEQVELGLQNAEPGTRNAEPPPRGSALRVPRSAFRVPHSALGSPAWGGPALLEAIAQQVVPCVNALFERFESFTGTLPGEELPAHRSYMRRQLHPLVLCAPFAYRTFHKPLGYAGDYEMVNMIQRNGWEGDSLFAKVVNAWFLRQPPAQAHRNRIAYLAERLRDESLRVQALPTRPGERRPRTPGAAGRGPRAAFRRARVFDLGCGPAHEVQQFLRESPLRETAAFTFLDFNEETLRHLEAALAPWGKGVHQGWGLPSEDAPALAAAQTPPGRGTLLTYVRKSVQQLLKESLRNAERGTRNGETAAANTDRGIPTRSAEAAVLRSGFRVPGSELGGYDFVYCAGLFDYLPDQVCRRLMELMYDWLVPGGLLIATNVEPSNPLRNGMEHLLDWHLIYRTGPELLQLRPRDASPDEARVLADATGTNVFLEVRKPSHG